MNASAPSKINKRPASDTATRKAILVLGMHRSGTSAVSRCLNLLGADIGNKLLAPAEDNRPGFWEHAEVVSIHEELLADIDRRWSDARVMPDGWLRAPAARRARDKLIGLIRNDFNDSALWAVKDPRLCRFMPLWREVLIDAGIEARALFVVRHPAEVARSLDVRDGLPADVAYLNWLAHFAEAEIGTRSMPRSLVTYDGLLSNWRDAFARVGRELGVKWPAPAEAAGRAIDAFLDRKERHHVFSRNFCTMPDVLDRLYGFCRAIELDAQGWKEVSGLVDSYRLVAPPFMDRVEDLLGEKRVLENKALFIEKKLDTTSNQIETAPQVGRSIPSPHVFRGEHAALYYRSAEQAFTAQRVCIRNHRWDVEGEKTFRFELASDVEMASVRFDPSCEAGAFNVDRLKVNGVALTDLRPRTRSVNPHVLERGGGEDIWLASNDGDPWVEFDVSDLVKSKNEAWIIEVHCSRHPVENLSGVSIAPMLHDLQPDVAKPITKCNPRYARDLSPPEGQLQHVVALQARGTRLEGELAASRQRSAQVQRETFCVTARYIELSNQLEAAHLRNADQAVRCSELARTYAELRAGSALLENSIASLHGELAEIKVSTLWRALVALRSILLCLPGSMRLTLRLGAKAAWWALTPWEMPARFRFFREQRVALHPVSMLSAKTDPITPKDDLAAAAGPEQKQTPSAAVGYTYMAPTAVPKAVGKALLTLSRPPLLSVIVPIYNTDPGLLRRTIASVDAQWYPHWELILVDDHSSSPGVREVLDAITDPRVVVVGLNENRHISAATNEGIARASGDFIVFLDHDDELTVDCLYELAQRIDRDDPDYLYSDEDKLDADGSFRDPFFKPDWSPDTIMSIMFTCHVSCVRRSLALEVGGLRGEYDGSQDWDFVLRVSERARRIAHIPKVLYHWRVTPDSCASGLDVKPYAIDAGKRAREDALRRRGRSGELVAVPGLPGHYRTRYHLQGEPLISIIIPSRNNGTMLKTCIDSIFERTTYRLFEVVVINNGSTDEPALDYLSELRRRKQVCVLDHDVPFNYSRINNFGVHHSRGELLVFLNDDTEVLSADWLTHMGGYAQLPHVGAVGAKLLYPATRTVQHAGVLNLADGPRHAFANAGARDPGYFTRNMLEHDWIAVTGACLMLEREKFDAVGGFDEDLAITHNDVALCFSLTERGFFQVVCPGVELIHHESMSRGKDSLDRARMARLDREKEILFGKHPGFYDHDPFHNPNLAPNDVYFGLRQ